MAVAHPCDRESLRGALMAADAGLINPILVGPESKILAVALEYGLDLKQHRIVNSMHSHDSAAIAVRLVRDSDAEAIMKGSRRGDQHRAVAR